MKFEAIWHFVRPHTIIGTSLAVIFLYGVASLGAALNLPLLFLTLCASLLINVYIVGLNQLTDIEIDKINKPYLPLASGQLTPLTAALIALGCLLTALAIAASVNMYLLATIGLVGFIGTLYSLPPVRLKRFSKPAGLSIVLARGIIANGGIYLSYTHALTGKAQLPAHVLVFIAVMTCFCVVIAMMKDIPDVEGDRQHAISTFATQWGAQKVLEVCRVLVILSYVLMMVSVGVTILNPLLTITAHSLLLGLFLWKSYTQRNVPAYYMFIWKLFYLEFIIFFAGVWF